MIWFGKSFIKICKSFINLIKLVSTRTCRLARVRQLLLQRCVGHGKTLMAGNEVDQEIRDADGCIKETESSSY